MGKPKFDPPSPKFPYKITRRLNLLSVPKKQIIADSPDEMPPCTPRGVRTSALKAHLTDRVHDIAWPYIRKFLAIKRSYKTRFSSERMERVERMIEAANTTCYTKLANCMLDLKKPETKEVKKKKGWSESEWKKHMEYISQIAFPKKDHTPPKEKKGKGKPLEALLPRINEMISDVPEFKLYRRLSMEPWYRNPEKVAPNALKYVITDRTKKLAVPRVIPQPTTFD